MPTVVTKLCNVLTTGSSAGITRSRIKLTSRSNATITTAPTTTAILPRTGRTLVITKLANSVAADVTAVNRFANCVPASDLMNCVMRSVKPSTAGTTVRRNNKPKPNSAGANTLLTNVARTARPPSNSSPKARRSALVPSVNAVKISRNGRMTFAIDSPRKVKAVENLMFSLINRVNTNVIPVAAANKTRNGDSKPPKATLSNLIPPAAMRAEFKPTNAEPKAIKVRTRAAATGLTRSNTPSRF